MNGLVTVLSAGASRTPPFIEELGRMMLPAPGQEILAYLAFAFYAGLIAAGGLAAVLARNLVRAMLGLVVTFLGVAGMYLLMASPFMAFMQLLIYIGAISVLIFFAIMLVRNTSSGEEMNLPGLCQAGGALVSAAAAAALCGPVIALNAGRLNQPGPPGETPLAELGEGLLSYYVAPLELISIVLLVAMAGGVLLAWDQRYRGRQ
ncbi:MAG: NADH-quinone oxidoreductase subunit J [Candidatus Adiutrix sp.]|jgi:NADH-quinone oxidoreductase subunit J|nr:NADH-quinone oxidoreductase subunit J [Candidatus Adiutrix sp.]